MNKAHDTIFAREAEIRRLAGACYLAMRPGDVTYLAHAPSDETLELSGLAGTYANLCSKLGVETDRNSALRGMQLSATNKIRWQMLQTLLSDLSQKNINPVLFKGGALHARWPEMRDMRAMFDYDLIVPQTQVNELRSILAAQGFETQPVSSRLVQRLSKGWMVWKGAGLSYQNLDIHARVTEPPVCSSLTRSILGSREYAGGVRIPDINDCVCMIALHIVRSGMYRPLREYIDLLWYVDDMSESQWRSLLERAKKHQLWPALFLSLRQAKFCLALDELAPDRADAIQVRISDMENSIDAIRRRMLDWLAPPDYPLHPVQTHNHPLFRRSFILGAGTDSLWRVCAAFGLYGSARIIDRLLGHQATYGENS